MKFKARYLVEHEVEFELQGSIEQAAEHIARTAGRRAKHKILGVIAEGHEWPDAEKPVSRPPRNTPPSGSPGTPSLPETTALLSCIAA